MVTQAQRDDDLDLQARIGLLGTVAEREEAVRLLFARYERPVMRFLADRFPDLDSDERASAVHDAFRTLYKLANDGEFDPDRPVSGLLFTVAKRRALDLRRKNSRRIRADVNLNEELGENLAGTETGRDWSL